VLVWTSRQRSLLDDRRSCAGGGAARAGGGVARAGGGVASGASPTCRRLRSVALGASPHVRRVSVEPVRRGRDGVSARKPTRAAARSDANRGSTRAPGSTSRDGRGVALSANRPGPRSHRDRCPRTLGLCPLRGRQGCAWRYRGWHLSMCRPARGGLCRRCRTTTAWPLVERVAPAQSRIACEVAVGAVGARGSTRSRGPRGVRRSCGRQRHGPMSAGGRASRVPLRRHRDHDVRTGQPLPRDIPGGLDRELVQDVRNVRLGGLTTTDKRVLLVASPALIWPGHAGRALWIGGASQWLGCAGTVH
jgi:hypothetical protein